MRRFRTSNLLALLAMLLWSSSAMAITLAPGANLIEFVNWENRIAVDNQAPIAVGDRFYGIARIQTITANVDGGTDPFNSTSNPVHNLTAYFYTQVTSLAPATTPQNVIITFGAPTIADPNGIITNTERAAGVVFKIYEDFSTNIDFATLGTSIATATDGTLWMSLTDNGGYWWSEALGNPTGLAPGTFIGNSWFGLNTFFSSVGPLAFINDPLEDRFNLNVNAYANSTIETNRRLDGSSGKWTFTSDDPATIAPAPIPEPISMMLMGSGLLGMFAVRRRKSNG